MDTMLDLPPWSGTRWRIGGAFSLLALALFAVVGVLSGEHVAQLRQRDATAALQQAADQLAQTLSNGLAERYHEIQHTAQLSPLTGHRLAAQEWRAWLQQLQQSSPHYTWIGVADQQGRVLAATGGLLEGQDVSQRPWFIEGSRAPWMGGVHPAKLLASLLPPAADGEPLRLFDIAAPIPEDDGAVIGAHLSLAWVEAQRQIALKSMPALRGVEMRLIDRENEQLLGPPLDPRHATEPSFSAEASIHAPGSQPLGWKVVVRQPESVALAEARGLRRQLWLLGLAGATLFGLVGWWLAGRLTAPLRQVAHAARHAAEATGTAMPASMDEVDQLATALSSLLQQLHEREQSLRQLNGTLEQRVAERTESLHQANQDLSLFARSISHDLKAPIGGMATLLRHLLSDDTTLCDSTRHAMMLLANECERLGALTQRLLDLGRLEQRQLSLGPVPMGPLAQEVVNALRREGSLAPHTQVTLDDLPVVHGDAVLLRQVWQNLIGNALKFSAQAVTPHVQIQAQAADGQWVFEVLDNGIGFDAQQQHRLFGAFQRLHDDSDYPGTGLGLSIVQRLVQRHGGRVWAGSRPGGGAIFGFSLPMQQPTLPAAVSLDPAPANA